MQNKIKLVGGPRDGAEFISDGPVPSIITNDNVIFLGNAAYLLVEVDDEEQIAIFSHISLSNPNDTTIET